MLGIMLVYDVTDVKSFNNIAKWLRAIQEHANPNVEKIILGNKCDIEDKRVISKERGELIAKENGVMFIETSAKTNNNIEEAFVQLAECILEKTLNEAEILQPTLNLKPVDYTARKNQKCCTN